MHWQMQLDFKAQGIILNGYRKAKKDEYRKRHNSIVLARKRREVFNTTVEDRCPIGRLAHLDQQIERRFNYVQAR